MKRKQHKSWGEYYIKQILEKYNVKYTREKKLPGCLSPKNNSLRFDFYLSDYNILIEYQGMHHYKPVNKYYKAKKIYNQTKIHDQIKKNYCNKYNIPLIEICYLDLDPIKIENIIREEVGKILKS